MIQWAVMMAYYIQSVYDVKLYNDNFMRDRQNKKNYCPMEC